MGTTEDGGSEGLPEKIFVSVRLRPLNENEIVRNDTSDWECINDGTIILKNSNDLQMFPTTAYTFDRVFTPDCSTRQVYEEGAKEVALSVLNGINTSIFAYGQTSSGKTYTMTGITECSLRDIYDYMQKHTERKFLLKFSAMEIYNESVRDLLSTDSSLLRLLDDPERGTTVEKLTEESLRDLDHAMGLLSICEAQRQRGETFLNEASSRSHQIIRLTIESSAHEFLGKDNSSTIAASVNFVDLAGSERASQSLSAGPRLKEGCHINRSLLTLGTVIRKLSSGRNEHIPFRDSKLTRILQSSLGGNARTSIICTMSPARSHVEQSRNTLLFASCAKEVTTNAQVNVPMSEKDFDRLDCQLTSGGPTFSTSEFAAILQEKDLRIEKLEKEVTDLTLQRDVAQSQIQDLLRVVGDDRDSMIWVGLNQYPHLRVRKSPESEKTSQSLDGDMRTLDTSQYSDGQSELEENFPNNDMSPRLLTSTNSIGSDSRQAWEEIEERTDRASEDLCKEVRCIETEESNSISDLESNNLCLEENAEISALKLPQVNEDRELSYVNPPFVVLSPENPSPWAQIEDSFSSRSMSLTKSRSCNESLVIENTSRSWFEREFIGRLEGFPRKFCSLHYGAEVESLSRKASQSSNRSAAFDELEAQNAKTRIFENFTSKSTRDARLKRMMGAQHENRVAESLAHGIESKDSTVLRNVKDVGLDSIEDYSRGSLSDWPSEFKRLQREIVQLWNACNVSLVHRTYFFLMFKGDPTDSIYMQVELRRLSFLKDTFSQGGKTVEEFGRTLTPASSMKGLRRERKMLSKEMQKRLTEEDRESLYLKWGIGLNTRYRRLQLADRLWTNTEDMNHIAESAIVVANLVGFIELGQAPKEMFGLDFAPRHGNSLRSKVISLF